MRPKAYRFQRESRKRCEAAENADADEETRVLGESIEARREYADQERAEHVDEKRAPREREAEETRGGDSGAVAADRSQCSAQGNQQHLLHLLPCLERRLAAIERAS